MATNPKQIKINTLAKDFNMKTKDVIDILAAAGIDKKTSGTIDTDEFAVFMSHATTGNQITNTLDCKEIQAVHSEGGQPWDFFGGNDAEAETPVFWSPHAKR